MEPLIYCSRCGRGPLAIKGATRHERCEVILRGDPRLDSPAAYASRPSTAMPEREPMLPDDEILADLREMGYC